MAASPKTSYLYVLGDQNGPCKIGWTWDVKRRARTILRPAGRTDVLHKASITNGYALFAERYAHWMLRDHHFRNEWFNVKPEIAIEAVNTAVALNFRTVGLIPTLADFHSVANFEKGTMARIDSSLIAGEKRSDLIREAVDRELKRRDVLKRRKGQ